MFSRLNHVGFNITRTKLQLVEVVRESSKFCLENVDEHIFEEELNFNQDESKIIFILQTALNSLTSRAPLKSNNISISIPLKEFKVFEIPFEASLSQSAFDEHIKWEFSILFPMLEGNDYTIRSLPLVNHENQKRLLVVGLAKKTIKAIYNFSTQNNLVLKSIDNSHFAFNSTINLSEIKNTLSIYLCSISCSINSYLGKNLQTIQQFEIIDTKSLVDSVSKFVDDQNIAYDNIFLASTFEIDDLKIALEEKLNRSIDVTNPFELLVTSESFIQNAHFMNKPNSFSAAAGICYRKV